MPLYERFCEEACRHGIAAMLYDLRGTGLSGGSFGYGVEDIADAKRALQLLKSMPFVDRNRISIVGHSLGGTIAAHAAAGEGCVRALALWATPPDHEYNVRKFILRRNGRVGLLAFQAFSMLDRAGFPKRFQIEIFGLRLRLWELKEGMMRLSTARLLRHERNPPALLAIGDKDQFVDIEEANELFRAMHEPKRLVVLNGGNHNFVNVEEKLIKETLDWLDSCL